MRIYKEKNRGKVAPVWTVAIADQHGNRRKFAGFRDKATTQELGRKLERLVAARVAGRPLDGELTSWLEHIPASFNKRLVNCGLIDAACADATRPLMIASLEKRKWMQKPAYKVRGGHLADFEEHMQARELAPRHVLQVISHCARFFDQRSIAFPSDITTSAIESHIAHLRVEGASARTANTAIAALKSFCRWMMREGRMAGNPVTRVNLLNEKADRRLVRRALSTEEARELIRHTANGPFHHGCTGAERALIYRLALSTGLRMNEIRTLEKSDFHLDGERPVVTVKAEHEKAKRGAVLPLSGDSALAKDLAAYFDSRPLMLLENSNPRAFPNMPTKGAEMLRADAQYARKRLRVKRYKALRCEGANKAAARKEADAMGDSDFLKVETAQGRIDFHALRHTFGTWLARSGVHPKVCQEMMRHADIETTMQLYTHTLLDDKDKAARALPDIGALSGGAGTGRGDGAVAVA